MSKMLNCYCAKFVQVGREPEKAVLDVGGLRLSTQGFRLSEKPPF